MVDQIGLDQHATAGLERRPNADVDRGRHARRQTPRRRRGPGRRSPPTGRRWRSESRACARACRPRRRSPSSRNGAPRQRIAPSTSPAATRARIRVEETVSPSTSTSGTTLVSNSSWERSMSGSPLAFLPKRKFSPTETRLASSVSIRIREQNSSASIARELVVEGDDHQLLDAEPLDHVALDLERHDQLRRRLGVDDAERVRLEGQHRVGALDDLAVPDVDAVERADRDLAWPADGLGQRRDLRCSRARTYWPRGGRARQRAGSAPTRPPRRR